MFDIRITSASWVVLFATAAFLPVGAYADPLESQHQAPQDLRVGSYDAEAGFLNLTWEPADPQASNITYTVYMKGQPYLTGLNRTYANLTFPAGPMIYFVTATGPNGTESMPSRPLGFVPVRSSAAPTSCDAVFITITTSPPSVEPEIRPECLPSAPPYRIPLGNGIRL